MRTTRSTGVLAVAMLLALTLIGCDSKPDKPRKQQTVKLLPDTPPPPPPPPKPEDKPQPPKPEDKPQPQDAPKPAEAPQPQALKTDEAPGSGPGGGLSSGAVTQDYTDQKVGQGTTIGGGGGDSGSNRLAMTAYGNAATRALNEYLVRDKAVKLRDYKVRVDLWLTASGSLQRAELLDSTGDPDTDKALRGALDRFPGTSNAPPPRLPQPLRVQVSNRLMG
jgi:protein TonB